MYQALDIIDKDTVDRVLFPTAQILHGWWPSKPKGRLLAMPANNRPETLFYYDTKLITAVKNFIVHGSSDIPMACVI